jgi:hypothetical protein
MLPAFHPRTGSTSRRWVLGLAAGLGAVLAVPAIAKAADTPAAFIQTIGDQAVAVLDDSRALA